MLASAPALVASPAFANAREGLVEAARFLSQKGWTPATSSNFSARIAGVEGAIAISRSGVDKAGFSAADVMVIDNRGANVWPAEARSSAETLIHLAIYDSFDAGAVLHTHSVNATAFSIVHAKEERVTFSGLELLKGLSGITTHEASIEVPIFPNDQDMGRFAAMLRRGLAGAGIYGFLVEGHGLYSWGKALSDARRHIEVFEFLFELAFRMEGNHGNTHDS